MLIILLIAALLTVPTMPVPHHPAASCPGQRPCVVRAEVGPVVDGRLTLMLTIDHLGGEPPSVRHGTVVQIVRNANQTYTVVIDLDACRGRVRLVDGHYEYQRSCTYLPVARR